MYDWPPITTYGEAAVIFDVMPNTIGDIAERQEFKYLPVPRNGKAKGLTPELMNRLAEILGPPRRTPSAAAS